MSGDDSSRAIEILKKSDQDHILKSLETLSKEKADELFKQVIHLDEEYPGGLVQYVANARELLLASKEGKNPYEGYTPKVPIGERLDASSDAFSETERIGMEEIKGACFVIVAGGLGERLGYNGIKLALPAEIVTEISFIGLYCAHILALQDRAQKLSGSDVKLPLCIMTSGDTHEKTVDLLETHNYYNMKEQIVIVKQEKVPALLDNDGHFALEQDGLIETKPHGHGDVHTLLHSHGVVQRWEQEGRKWVCFLQDTNGLVFHAIPAAIGVSVKNNFAVNSLTVPRRAGEAVGGICRLEHTDGSGMTLNVEYNQLDPLLRAVGKDGDTADETGFSPFPGNINVLVFELGSYRATLERTNGSIPEFVNPKYGDAAKSVFKKPTRLECMMQDYPKLLPSDVPVGFTQMDRWVCFSAVKNNIQDAAQKMESTGVAECASSGESDMYYINRRLLAEAGVAVEVDGPTETFAGVKTMLGAKVVLHPSFATTVAEIKEHFPTPSSVKISAKSTLYVEGDVTFESLELDGTLIIRCPAGSSAIVRDLKVNNAGWHFKALKGEEAEVAEKYHIRGYTLEKLGQHEVEVPQATKGFVISH